MIFIVDDDQSVRQSLSFLFDSEGMESQSFPDAYGFLGSCHLADGDCLIVDVDMPGMDGIQLLQRVRAQGLTLPVFVVTGNPSTFVREQARAAGATAFLEKPVNAAEIISLIRNSGAAAS